MNSLRKWWRRLWEPKVPLEDLLSVRNQLHTCRAQYRQIYHKCMKWEMAAKYYREEYERLSGKKLKAPAQVMEEIK